MSSSVQYSAFTRLLSQNNRVHDLRNQLRSVAVPMERGPARPGSEIAQMQEEIDRVVRASLTTCWLGMPDEFVD